CAGTRTAAGGQYHEGAVTENVTALDNGNFIVTWSDSSGQDGSGWGVYGRVFHADGTPVTNEFLVNGTTTGNQLVASTGYLQDGRFVVTWRDDANGNGEIFARQYDASGNPVGGEFQVNTWTANWQDEPQVQGLSDGGYVIVWQSYGDDGTNTYQIAGQRYDSDGNAMGGEF